MFGRKKIIKSGGVLETNEKIAKFEGLNPKIIANVEVILDCENNEFKKDLKKLEGVYPLQSLGNQKRDCRL